MASMEKVMEKPGKPLISSEEIERKLGKYMIIIFLFDNRIVLLKQ